MKTQYAVETLRSGQPRPYADHENEYLITVQSYHYGTKSMQPWVLLGDVEARISAEVGQRARGEMSGGQPPDELRKRQRDWAIKLVKTLCQDFREKTDDDGRTGMSAAFYPTLQWLKIDPAAGTIRVLITSEYTG